jgi:AraC-like DNA-binding protein
LLNIGKMKIISFTIPANTASTVLVQDETLPHFYQYLHRHQEIQITHILHGTGTLVAGNYLEPFMPGDIFIIGANIPHLFRSDTEYFVKGKPRSVRSLSLYFDPVGMPANLLSLPEMKAARKFISLTSGILKAPEKYTARIGNLLDGLNKAKGAAKLTGLITLLDFLSNVTGWKIWLNETATGYSDREGMRINDVFQYIMSHYSENTSLDTIASVAHLTPQAFCRFFKKHTRKTFVAFVNELRINEACRMLTTGQFETMADIAYTTGFQHVTTFNRVFKQVMEKSPGEYLHEFSEKVKG